VHGMAEQLAHFSPETNRRYAQCLKKVGYPSRQEADAVRERRQVHTDEVLRVYGPCEDCGLWHLTHRPLTNEQALELEDLFIVEIRRLGEAWQRLQQLAKPYVKEGYALRRRTPQSIDEDFARVLDLQGQVFDHWFALHQRTYALQRAHATTAADARAIDRRAHRVLEESLQRRDEDHENALRLHQLHRAAAHEAMNAAFALPSFGWRTHLTR
jgi:hypothetical protein